MSVLKHSMRLEKKKYGEIYEGEDQEIDSW